jgi:hypothetical protein
MDSSELLRLQLAKKLECSRIGYASGPTGPTGPTGSTGPRGYDGNTKFFTFFLDWSSPNVVSRIFIPPGFSTDPALIGGGVAVPNQYSSVQFSGQIITITNTAYTFPVVLFETNLFVFNASIPITF